jgi:hypothetical protein
MSILSSVSCPAPQYSSTLPHKRYDFGKKMVFYLKCVLIFSTTFVWNISHSKKIWEIYDQKCILVFTQIARYSCRILIKLENSWQIFEKFSNKFKENASSGSRAAPCGSTDGHTRHDKADSRFMQFYESAKKLIQYETFSSFLNMRNC